MKDRTKDKTLAWVNGVRVERGLDELAELMMGRPEDGRRCPVARSLPSCMGVWASGSGEFKATVEVGDEEKDWGYASYECPGVVNKFIKLFDAGRYPELVEGGNG